MFENAKWIWCNASPKADEYGEFYSEFEYILSSIEEKYRPMVDYGTGTVWETELGQSDFENAGSLCHGWSAIPVYYYHLLKNNLVG